MKTETRDSYSERMLAVLVHIQGHLDEPLSLERLAAIAYFSPFHFHRIFRGMVGESVHEHVRRLRLERAAMRLKSTELPVIELALEAGYESHEAFTRAFSSVFGAPPSEFRKSVRPVLTLPAASGVHYVADGLREFLPAQRKDGPMDVKIEKREAVRVAFMRHVGPYSQVGQTWGKLYAWAGKRGHFPPFTKFFAMIHDDPEITAPERLRYDACFQVNEKFKPQGEVGVQELSAGEYAVAVHTGPYDTLGETYAYLCGEWAAKNGREIRSTPSWEVYLNDPRRTKPEALKTEVHVPLES